LNLLKESRSSAAQEADVTSLAVSYPSNLPWKQMNRVQYADHSAQPWKQNNIENILPVADILIYEVDEIRVVVSVVGETCFRGYGLCD